MLHTPPAAAPFAAAKSPPELFLPECRTKMTAQTVATITLQRAGGHADPRGHANEYQMIAMKTALIAA